MFTNVRKYIPSSPSPIAPYFLTDAQLQQLLIVKYDFVCSLDRDQAIARMVEMAKVYAQNLHSISTVSTGEHLLTAEGSFSPLASAITPLIGCLSDSGLQVIHYEAKRCLKSPIMSKNQALRITTDILDFLPTRSFVILADMSSIPTHAWLRGKFAGIGNIWSYVLNVLCHEWACNVGRVICYHVSFSTQAYISTKINEPAVETIKFSRLSEALKNMGHRCTDLLEKYLSDLSSARKEWESYVMTAKRNNSIQAYRSKNIDTRDVSTGSKRGIDVDTPSTRQSAANDPHLELECSLNADPPVLASTEIPPNLLNLTKAASRPDITPLKKESLSYDKFRSDRKRDHLSENGSDSSTDQGDEVMT